MCIGMRKRFAMRSAIKGNTKQSLRQKYLIKYAAELHTIF